MTRLGNKFCYPFTGSKCNANLNSWCLKAELCRRLWVEKPNLQYSRFNPL